MNVLPKFRSYQNSWNLKGSFSTLPTRPFPTQKCATPSIDVVPLPSGQENAERHDGRDSRPPTIPSGGCVRAVVAPRRWIRWWRDDGQRSVFVEAQSFGGQQFHAHGAVAVVRFLPSIVRKGIVGVSAVAILATRPDGEAPVFERTILQKPRCVRAVLGGRAGNRLGGRRVLLWGFGWDRARRESRNRTCDRRNKRAPCPRGTCHRRASSGCRDFGNPSPNCSCSKADKSH